MTFERVYYGSPKEALLRVEEVLALYLDIITQSSSSVDWSCETEFAQQEHLPAFAYSPPSTGMATVSTGSIGTQTIALTMPLFHSK